MKNFLALNLLVIMTLVSCDTGSSQGPDYPNEYIIDINHLNLLPSEILLYVFTDYCGHCQRIKEDVILLSSEITIPLYFLELDDTIQIVDNYIEVLEADYPNEVKVIGVPSLLVIEDKKNTFYYMGESDVLNGLKNYLPTPL